MGRNLETKPNELSSSPITSFIASNQYSFWLSVGLSALSRCALKWASKQSSFHPCTDGEQIVSDVLVHVIMQTAHLVSERCQRLELRNVPPRQESS